MARKSKRTQKKTSLPWGWVVFGSLAVVLIGAGVFLRVWGKSKEPQAAALPVEISVQQAYEKYEAGVYVLDVRTLAEWNEYHIPHTHFTTLDELEKHLDLLPRGKEIVVVCRSGNRSLVAARMLREKGFNAASMSGGLDAWRAAGYPLEP